VTLTLHTSARAAGPYRVRIALNLKGIAYTPAPVDLAAAEQHKAAYRALNPQKLLPTLEGAGDDPMTQSLAIIEWLEETHPEPPLLPTDPRDRATVRAMADIVACDIHPLNNLRVLRALETIGVSGEARMTWAKRWINDGFAALEPLVAKHGRGWAFGDTPGLADCFLIPQVANSRRFDVDLDPYPSIRAVWERSADHPAFHAAAYEQQPDFKPT
jgi:maleylacetoacetate isomerase/maleylpyruvate isomerase